MAHDEHNCSKIALGALLLGSVVGATTALLLAPKSGKQIRKDICEACEDISDKTHELACSIGDRGHDAAEVIQDQASELVDKARSILNSLSDGIQSLKGSVDSNISKLSKGKSKASHSRFDDALEWAELGLRFLQNFKKGS